MLTVILISVIIVIFPIFISGEFYLNKNQIKLFYKIKLFGIVKIIDGYAELIDDGIILHLTKMKAVLLPYSNIFEIKKKVEPLKDYHLINANLTLNIGIEDLLFATSTAFTVNYVYNYLHWFLSHYKPYFNFNNKVQVFVEQPVFEVFFNGTVVFNLLMVIFSFIKIMVGKIFYAIAK